MALTGSESVNMIKAFSSNRPILLHGVGAVVGEKMTHFQMFVVFGWAPVAWVSSGVYGNIPNFECECKCNCKLFSI